MKKIALVLITVTVLLSGGTVYAASAGTSSGQILKLGGGARGAALSDAFTAGTGDASVVFYNPSALAYQQERSAMFTHAAWFESVTYDVASFVYPVDDKIGTFGAAIQMLKYGDIDSTDSSGNADGSFSPHDYVGMLSWGKKVHERVGVGVSAKFISSKISNSASTLAADFGVRGNVMEDLDLAFSAQNLGGKLKYASESESLPAIYRFGASYNIKKTVMMYADLNEPTDGKAWFAIGAEYGMKFSDPRYGAAARAGYNTRLGDARQDSSFPFSIGLGFTYERIGLDYAFAPYGDLGNTHHIGIKYSWGSVKN